MTPAEVVAALHGPRMPAGTAELNPWALVAAFGLGLLLALGLFALARPALRARRRAATPAQHLAALAALPEAARPLAAARIFADLGAPPPPAVAARLYAPRPARLDPAEIAPALKAAWSRATPEARGRAHV